MKCKLCQKISNLRKSHVIPEAFWTSIYDKKHRALPISLEGSDLKYIQKGIYEKLLCQDCEKKFSKWESVLKRDLRDFGKKTSNYLKIKEIKKTNGYLIHIKNIKYKEFKLAILSILWRMSISSDPFFDGYNLGPYEAKLRHLLFNETAPDEKQYPFMVSRFEIKGNFYPGIIMCSTPGKYGRLLTVQHFVIWGHRFSIFVNDRIAPDIPQELILRNSGELYVGVSDLTQLVNGNNVLSKIRDEKVQKRFQNMKW